MNKIILTGNFTKEITLKKTLDNKSVATTTIAVNRDYKTKGEYKTDFFDLVAYSQVADYLSSYAYKGGKCELVGRLETRQYETKEGVSRTIYEVIVESVKMLTKKQEEVKEVKEEELPELNLKDIHKEENIFEDDDDDLPF